MQSENRRRRCFGRAPPADRGEGNRLPRRICARQSAGAPPVRAGSTGDVGRERLDAPVRVALARQRPLTRGLEPRVAVACGQTPHPQARATALLLRGARLEDLLSLAVAGPVAWAQRPRRIGVQSRYACWAVGLCSRPVVCSPRWRLLR